MRIAFVCFDTNRFTFMSGLFARMEERGHECQAFMEHTTDEKHVRCRWMSFNIKPFIDFNPERVVIFNGYAAESAGATSWMSRRYKTHFMERGWLPQSKHVYIDPMGLGGRSLMALEDHRILSQAAPLGVQDVRFYLKKLYEPKQTLDADGYILVPLQIEKDTQITLDSPYFKTMKSLVSYVNHHFYDHRIVVKTHPYAPDFTEGGRAEVIKDIDMNSLVCNAKAVVGINSTSLIEALVHEKPILSLGNSILSNSKVFLGAEALGGPRALLNYKPFPPDIHAVLYNLLHKQFHADNPSETAMKEIEDGSNFYVV